MMLRTRTTQRRRAIQVSLFSLRGGAPLRGRQCTLRSEEGQEQSLSPDESAKSMMAICSAKSVLAHATIKFLSFPRWWAGQAIYKDMPLGFNSRLGIR